MPTPPARRPASPLVEFSIGLAVAIGAALVVPQWGARGAGANLLLLSPWVVGATFFLMGLALPGEVLRAGLLRWRLHAGIQLFIFGFWPLVVWPLAFALRPLLGEGLALGFLFLALLPTTLSTAAVQTAQAEGDVAVAVTNSALSNLFGVFWVPLVSLAFLAGASQVTPDPVATLAQVAVQLLLPLVLGQGARRWLAGWAAPRKKLLQRLGNGCVFFLVYLAAADTVWRVTQGRMTLGVEAAVGLVLCLVLFAAMWAGTRLAARLGRLPPPQATALFYCGTQKTLAAGVPLANAIFGQSPLLGLILLPVLLYHPLQLIAGAWWASHQERAPTGSSAGAR